MTHERLETSCNWRPMGGNAVATMVWSRAARNIVSMMLIRMVRTSLGVSGARGAIGGASLMSMTSPGISESSRAISSGNTRCSAGCWLCRSYLFMRDGLFGWRGRKAAWNRCFTGYLGVKSKLRQHLARMGASREGKSRLRDRSRRISGFWPLFQPRPLGQQRRPSHDMILEIGVGDVVLGALHATANRNTGLMNGIGIAGDQRMPPIEIASLRHQ